MGRRRRNSDAALVEGIAGLVGLAFLLVVFNPKLMQQITSFCIVVGSAGFLLIVALVAFKVYRSRRRKAGFTIPSRVTDVQTLNTTVHEPRPYSHGPTIAAPLSPASPARPPERITQDDLRSMDWFQFEKVMAALYAAAGEYRVERRGGANPDGGIDLVLHKGGERMAVQCKHWKVWNVGVRHLREFFGGMKAEGFDRGIFVTLCGYTGEARKFADENGIAILNAQDVEAMLDRYGGHNNGGIRAILEDPTKHCPKCGAQMVIRTARRGPDQGGQFWGCTRYPRCNGKMRLSD